MHIGIVPKTIAQKGSLPISLKNRLVRRVSFNHWQQKTSYTNSIVQKELPELEAGLCHNEKHLFYTTLDLTGHFYAAMPRLDQKFDEKYKARFKEREALFRDLRQFTQKMHSYGLTIEQLANDPNIHLDVRSMLLKLIGIPLPETGGIRDEHNYFSYLMSKFLHSLPWEEEENWKQLTSVLTNNPNMLFICTYFNTMEGFMIYPNMHFMVDAKSFKNNLTRFLNWGIPKMKDNISGYGSGWNESEWIPAAALSILGGTLEELNKNLSKLSTRGGLAEHWNVALSEIIIEAIALMVPKSELELAQMMWALDGYIKEPKFDPQVRTKQLCQHILKSHQFKGIDPEYTMEKGLAGTHTFDEHTIMWSYIMRRKYKSSHYGPPKRIFWQGEVVRDQGLGDRI
ncbi:MAG: hypothetical protein HQ564_08410 [Candidatus Saganbacteria bacterium]|nr:hypothetical protein [Candidatus Saganbacteria bacterium]